ncbi:MAG: hypothetical protein HKN49_07295, partial [Gammaproteobacteria bacterium]|nr:hypothetical protein [Gammaproteobacteria bacterium]
FAAIASGGDQVIVTEFCVRYLEQEAPLQLVMPRAMLEPIEEVLDSTPRSDDDAVDDKWTEMMQARLGRTSMVVQARLTETELRLGDVLNLQAGDLIPVELPDEITLDAAGYALFTGRAGASRKHNAIEITGRVSTEQQED